MKVYVQDNGVTIVGKAWQVKRILKQYRRQFETVDQWIHHAEGKSSKVIQKY